MSDLRERVAGQALMEKLISYRGTKEMREFPLGMVWISNEIVSWWRGVRGELDMARELDALGDGWSVFHSIPFGNRGSDIDHLVIGPPGVFPINSKRITSGRAVRVTGDDFRVDGRLQKYLRNAYFEGERIETILRAAHLRAPIVPIIAISGTKSIRVRKPMWSGWNIGVERVDRVVRRIRKRPTRVSPEELARITEVLLNPTVWTRRTTENADTAALRAEFKRIDHGIRRWNLALFTAISVGFLALCVGVSTAWTALFL
jgi:hypothetical protein